MAPPNFLSILFPPLLLYNPNFLTNHTKNSHNFHSFPTSKMKLKSRLSYFTSTVSHDDNILLEKLNPKPFNSDSNTITPTASLQSNTSLQTLPSVPSLQIHLVDPTSTYSLSSSINLSSPITSLSLSSTSSLLYVSSGHEVNVYNSDTLTYVDMFNAKSSSSGSVKSISFSKNKILTAHQDGKICVWKINVKPSQEKHHKLVSTLPKLSDRLINFPIPKNHVKVRRHKTRLWVEHNDAVSSLAVTDSRIYSVSWDKTLKVWGARDFTCKESVTASEDAVNAVIVSSSGVVFTGSAEGRIKVWSNKSCVDQQELGKNLLAKEKKHSLIATLEKHKSAVNALALNKDGSILFSGACDRSILVWERVDSSKYMTISGALRGHQGAILCLINVSDFLISGSADLTVRIWARGIHGQFSCLTVLTGHKKAVKCLAAKMDGENGIVVFSGGLDGEIRVWSVSVL